MDIAPWVQAFAAVVVAVLTYHLVKATREYVRLTHKLAQAAHAQQEVLAAQRAADYDYLCALVEQLREQAGSLPLQQDTAPRMLGLSLWTEVDLYDLQRLAPHQGRASAAFTVIVHCRWLSNWVRKMEAEASKPPRHDVHWERIPWDEWARNLAEARKALDRLDDSLTKQPERGTFLPIGLQYEIDGRHVTVTPR
jgi:hypothetical protein